MEEHTERLDFESYDGLRETEAQLEALAEYLAADDPDLYLARLLAIAENELRWYCEYLDLPVLVEADPSLFDT